MDQLAPAGLALVSSGYLATSPLVLIADPLRLEIKTVDGVESFDALESESLNPVPGGATATSWMIYLPAPVGFEALVTECVKTSGHTSSDKPPAEPVTKETATNSVSFDLTRLSNS
jgi:hypothetical protein